MARSGSSNSVNGAPRVQEPKPLNENDQTQEGKKNQEANHISNVHLELHLSDSSLDEKNRPDDCGAGKGKLRGAQPLHGRRWAREISRLSAGCRRWFERCPAEQAGWAG